MPLAHLASRLDVAVGQQSRAGRKRANGDAIGIRVPTGGPLTAKGIVAVIADGVSAAEAGQEASHIAVSAFLSDYYSTHDTWSVETSASKVLEALNRWLYGQGQQFLSPGQGYATTFNALVLKSSSAWVFHVGDSRVYRLRDDELEQITRDHSLAVGPRQRLLSRALGIDLRLEVDCHRLGLCAGDLFVLATDGVHEWLATREWRELLGSAAQAPASDLDPLCGALLDRALENGSDDNLSIQLIRVEQPGDPRAEDVLAGVAARPFPPPLAPGHIIDGWKVVAPLQATSRSEVYLVEHTDDGQRAVLKAPSAHFEDDPAYIERFLMEAWVGSRIASAHVARVIRSADSRFLYHLVEYVPGPNLAQLLRERTCLAVVDAQNIALQVISGLRAFHRRDVLHQDLKTDNIIYSDEAVKIVDFGSCHVAGVSEIGASIVSAPWAPAITAHRNTCWTVPFRRAATSFRWAYCCTNCSPAVIRSVRATPAALRKRISRSCAIHRVTDSTRWCRYGSTVPYSALSPSTPMSATRPSPSSPRTSVVPIRPWNPDAYRCSEARARCISGAGSPCYWHWPT